MNFGHDDVRRLLELIDASPALDEIELTVGEVHLHIRRKAAADGAATSIMPRAGADRDAAAASGNTATPAPPPAVVRAAEADTVAAGRVAVRAPMVGTFYRAQAPGDSPFVEVGQSVASSDTVCLLEMMKLFSSVPAGVDGVVAEIRVADGDLVEYGQVLIVIDPRSLD